MYILGTFVRVWLMDTVNGLPQRELVTKVCGNLTFSKAREHKSWQMVHRILVIFTKVLEREREGKIGQMAVTMKETLKITISLGMELMYGPMVIAIRDNGKKIKCMEMVHLHGAMVKNISDSTTMM